MLKMTILPLKYIWAIWPVGDMLPMTVWAHKGNVVEWVAWDLEQILENGRRRKVGVLRTWGCKSAKL